MIVTIHQPEHMVWLGLLDKISKADIFVILDDTQYKKNYFENRNKIKTKDEWTWLTVPVKKHSSTAKIKDIEISYDRDWMKKYLNLIRENYTRAPYFKKYFPKIEEIINKKHKLLADLNIEILKFFLKEFDITPKKIIKFSDLGISDTVGEQDVNLVISRHLGAKTYISGPTGKEYLDLTPFKESGIEVTFHEFKHPTYPQLYGEFLPFMSSLDALFNLGESVKKLFS